VPPEVVLTLAAAAVAVGGFAQAVTGLGFALVASPLLVALLGPRQGVAVVVVLGGLASLLPLAREWRAVRVRGTLLLLVPTLLATPPLVVLVARVDTRVLAALAGVAVLAGVGALLAGLRARRLRGTGGAVAAGVMSAALTVVGGVGGPPVAMYVTNAQWPVEQARGSLQAFFVTQSVVTALALGATLPDWRLLAALALGSVLGIAALPRVPAGAARLATLGVAGLGGLALLLGSL
jgi:uncharacterized membrane protein YfcA